MIGGIKDWIMGILLVIALLAGWKAYQGHQEARQARAEASSLSTQLAAANGSLKAFLEDRDRRDELSQKRQRLTERKLRDARRQNKELSDALKDNPDWAAQPVPDSVWRSLGTPSADPNGKADAAPGVAGGVPGAAAPEQPNERGAGEVAERIRSGPGGL